MNKTKTTSAMLCLMAVANTSQAINVDITEMVFGNSYIATGTLTDSGDFGSMQSVTPFFLQPWFARSEQYFDTGANTIWTGTTTINGVISPFSYDVVLTDSQVAWSAWFNWSTADDVPVLVIMDCGEGNPGDVCTGIGTPMVSGPFPGQAPSFNGTVSAVPVPAAVWLFGSGLIGLAGVARCRKTV